MAEKTISYPFISEKTWWTLRVKFQSTLPPVVSETYVMGLLNMANENSARSNVISPLRRVGLIDQENKPTELAREWRLDESYKDACNIIIKNVYSDEFVDLFSGNDIDPNTIISWFMRLGVGKDAAKKMTSFFLLLKSGEVRNEKSTSNSNNSGSKKEKVTVQAPKRIKKKADTRVESEPDTKNANNSSKQPSLHIDLQIHISPDSTPEQIECIFSSMAKHLYGVME